MEKSEVISIKSPRSPITESYRTLRTNIQFSSFDKEVQVIVITSSGSGEGKTTTSANLAVVMAENGNNTILIDCDYRKPKLHKMFTKSNQKGIADIIAGKFTFEEAVQKTEIQNLDILTTGTTPPNPAELLASKKMHNFIEMLREKYEYIIIDTPPIVIVTDAQLLASRADGCILVVASSEAQREAAVKAKELLEKVNAKILGAVLNKLEVNGRGYYKYYYNYYYNKKPKNIIQSLKIYYNKKFKNIIKSPKNKALDVRKKS